MVFLNKPKSLSLMATNEEKLAFEVEWLNLRVANLEEIVTELLRGRVNKELVDGWLNTTRSPGFQASSAMIESRGKQIAYAIDRYPAENTQKTWPAKD